MPAQTGVAPGGAAQACAAITLTRLGRFGGLVCSNIVTLHGGDKAAGSPGGAIRAVKAIWKRQMTSCYCSSLQPLAQNSPMMAPLLGGRMARGMMIESGTRTKM